jgi:hypothetical protein
MLQQMQGAQALLQPLPPRLGQPLANIVAGFARYGQLSLELRQMLVNDCGRMLLDLEVRERMGLGLWVCCCALRWDTRWRGAHPAAAPAAAAGAARAGPSARQRAAKAGRRCRPEAAATKCHDCTTAGVAATGAPASRPGSSTRNASSGGSSSSPPAPESRTCSAGTRPAGAELALPAGPAPGDACLSAAGWGRRPPAGPGHPRGAAGADARRCSSPGNAGAPSTSTSSTSSCIATGRQQAPLAAGGCGVPAVCSEVPAAAAGAGTATAAGPGAAAGHGGLAAAA